MLFVKALHNPEVSLTVVFKSVDDQVVFVFVRMKDRCENTVVRGIFSDELSIHKLIKSCLSTSKNVVLIQRVYIETVHINVSVMGNCV